MGHVQAKAKSERIDVRVSSTAKKTLQRAAASKDKSVSEFLLDAGLALASETLAARTSFSLNEAQWKKFQALLDRPPVAKPGLSRLLNEPSVFERTKRS